MGRKVNLVGLRFGDLYVVAPAGTAEPRGQRLWACHCVCGNVVTLTTNRLNRGNDVSCGCFRRQGGRRHGHTNGEEKTGTYQSWTAMKARCLNPNDENYKYYGGRGITVCRRWLDFENFLADMGLRPSGKMSIERNDVNGNYEPGNCCWIPHADQSKNRR